VRLQTSDASYAERKIIVAGLGVPELLIILVIVVVLFGASRLAGIGTALGGGIREFKKAVHEDDKPEVLLDKTEKTDRQV
jgi:sec-independent protein translocase protein TatA